MNRASISGPIMTPSFRYRAMCLAVALAVSIGSVGCANTITRTAEGMGQGAVAGLYIFGNSHGHYDGPEELLAVGLGCAAVGGVVGGVFGFVSGFLMDISDFFAWLGGASPEPDDEVLYVQ